MGEKKGLSRITVSPYREYPTYQAAYELRSAKPEVTTEDVFKKAILYAIAWANEKIKDHSDILKGYPEPKEYLSFNLETMEDITQTEGYDVSAVYDAKNSIWAIRLFETDKDGKKRRFKSEITMKGTAV